MEFTMSARNAAACFVGVDLHEDTLTAWIIAAKGGEITYRTIACVAWEKVRELHASLLRPNVVAIGCDASTKKNRFGGGAMLRTDCNDFLG
jgi:hypothetical protein